MSVGIEAIGVYRLKYSKTTIRKLCEWQYRTCTPDRLQAAEEHLEGLVLIELAVPGKPSSFNVSGCSQCKRNARTDNSQVPYDERWLDARGTMIIGEAYKPPTKGPCRLAFFLHYFNPALPLYLQDDTVISLPATSSMPQRLTKIMRYEAP